jgi:outer membrane protein assembly factor BamB
MVSALSQSFRPVVYALLTLAAASPAVAPRTGRAAGVLVSYEDAARMGLERVWFAQAPIDPSRTRINSWHLFFDRFYCVTDSGLVAAFNAETGARLWTRQIGNSGIAAFGPDANLTYLGVVSGSRLYLLDRESGRLKWSRDLGGAPSSGPALTKDYAYVALATGRIEGYRLDDPKRQPWYYQSKGRTYLRPTTTGTVVSWPTTAGYLYVSGANEPGVRFRLRTNGDIVTSPAEMGSYIYIASLDGYLYCLNESNGSELWRYATGYPIMSSPAIVGKHAYVASIKPTLHCLDSTTGSPLWSIDGVGHFGAEGKNRVYGADRNGDLVVIDSKTGSLVGEISLAEGITPLVNDQTDRLYLVNDTGLIQCLREIDAAEPLLHRKPTELAAADAAAEEAAAKAGGQPGADANPFQADEPAAEDTPFEEEAAPGAADEAPADDAAPADEENPFGDF